MAEAAVDTLNILTKGATTSCENQLKEIFCAEKFPVCHEFKETMTWHNRSKCTDLLSKCSQKARDVFDKIKLCDKLSRGDDVQLTECKIIFFHNLIMLTLLGPKKPGFRLVWGIE